MRAALLVVLLAACAPRVGTSSRESRHDLVVSEEDCEGAPAEDFTVTHEAVLADLDVVERVLREGWAGFDQRQKEGVDWKAVFADLRAKVAELPEPVLVDDLRKYLARGLSPAQDHHLSFWWVDARGARHQSSAASAHLDAWTKDAAGEGAFMRRNPPRIERRALSLSAASPGDGWRRPVGGSLDTGKKPYERDGNVLRLRTLDTGRAPELDAFAKAAPELQAAPFIIIDLRGNQGGGDGPVLRFVEGLTHGRVEHRRIDQLVSDVTRQGEVNVATCEAARPDLERETRADFEKQRDEARAKLDEPTPREWKSSMHGFDGTALETYDKPVVLLVDKGCASSCESAVTILRTLRGTVVLGENTAGVGVFGEALEYHLPRTGLWMRAGSRYFPGNDESKGLMPDFWIDDDEPMAAARELAECLVRADCPLRK